MKTSLLIPCAAAAALIACDRSAPAAETAAPAAETAAPAAETAAPAAETATPAARVPAAEAAPSFDAAASTVRVSSTRQSWSEGQPWEKNPPRKRRSLGAILPGKRVLTTAEMVSDATYLELETTDGLKLTPATVVAVDYEANLALLTTEGEGSDFFDALVPLEIASPPRPGDSLDIIQVENNGVALVTSGPIQSLDVTSNFLPGQFFLTYEVKASMQQSASSFSLPALHNGRLAGMLTNYDSNDQISDVTATPIIRRFLDDAADGDYAGFPSLGIGTTATDDSNFRSWLKLGDDHGGLYVSSVRQASAADKAGVKEGDVLLAVDDREIDRLGYYEDPDFKRIFWSHLVRGSKAVGEQAVLRVLRDGGTLELTATLERLDPSDQLVPDYTFGQAPNFMVKGGLIFQELTRPLLESFGKEWESRAPLDLLDAYQNPEDYEDRFERIVFLSGVIATPATVGYESLRNLLIAEVNGHPIRHMKSLVEAFGDIPADGLHAIRFDDEEITVYLDEALATAVDGQLIQRGLTRLSRSE